MNDAARGWASGGMVLVVAGVKLGLWIGVTRRRCHTECCVYRGVFEAVLIARLLALGGGDGALVVRAGLKIGV